MKKFIKVNIERVEMEHPDENKIYMKNLSHLEDSIKYFVWLAKEGSIEFYLEENTINPYE